MGNQLCHTSQNENEPEIIGDNNIDSYYKYVNTHFELKDTQKLYESLLKAKSKPQIIEFLEKNIIKTKLKASNDKLLLNAEDSSDLKAVRLHCLAFVFYRMHMYSKTPFPHHVTDLEQTFLSYIQELVGNENYEKDVIKYKILLAFLLNHSRGLIDKEAQYLEFFAAAFHKIKTGLLFAKDSLRKLEMFQPKNGIEIAVKEGISKFQNSLNSALVKSCLLEFLSSIEIPKENLDLSIKIIKNVEIFICENELGINGMVGFEFIIISIGNIMKDCGYLGKYLSLNDVIMARVFNCMWHETGHYLLRKLMENNLAVIPRGKEDKPWKEYEAGYRLEYFLFKNSIFYNKKIYPFWIMRMLSLEERRVYKYYFE